MKYKILFLFIAVFIFSMQFISAADGVYLIKPSETGEEGSRAVFVPFGPSGKIEIGDKQKRVYLSEKNGEGKELLGYMKNVVIRKEGSLFSVEFKQNGFIGGSIPEPPAIDYKYEHIKSSGKIFFDNKGKALKAEFEATEKSTYYFGGKGYEISPGVHLKIDDENADIKINSDESSFSYFSADNPSEKKSFNGLKSGGSFKIENGELTTAEFETSSEAELELKGEKYSFPGNAKVKIENGELTTAEFETSSEFDFKIRGYKYSLPSGSKVKIEGKKISIILSDGAKLEEPEKINDNADSEVVFLFSSESEIGMILSNDEIVKNREGATTIGYKDGYFYLVDKNVAVRTGNGQDDFLIHNPDSERDIYLIFDKSKISEFDSEKQFIFFSRDEIIASSLKGKGPGVFFAENNRLGMVITSENTAAMQAVDGRAFAIKRQTGKIPNIRISGNSITTIDRKSFFGEGGNKFYYNPSKTLESSFSYGSSSTALKVNYVDNNGNDILPSDYYSNFRNQYGSAPRGMLNNPMESFGRDYVHFSNTLAFNYLSLEAQKFYSSLNVAMRQQIAAYAGNGEKENAATLQGILNRLILIEEERKKYPIRASVRIPSGSGSGTIIGVDANGYPIVLTAGHLRGATSPGAKEKIQLSDGREFRATVIKGIANYWGGSGWDLSLMRINTQVPGIPYIPVASASHIVNNGDPALRIGCPGCGKFKQTPNRITSINRDGTYIYTTSDPFGGESGGGLFHQGRLIGVVSIGTGSSGGYPGVARIREFLVQNGLGYLIQFVMALLNE